MDEAIISLTTKWNGLGMGLYILITCVISGILSLSIGLERELKGQAAGLRTHVITTVACSALMSISIYAIHYAISDYSTLYYDASRIGAGILSGIGFMGAGAIIKNGANVRGLTTAATLFLCAAIGMACGAGYILEAIIVTAIAFALLVSLSCLERELDRVSPCVILVVETSTPIINKTREAAEKCTLQIKNVKSQIFTIADKKYREVKVFFPFWAGNVYILDFCERFANQSYIGKISYKNLRGNDDHEKVIVDNLNK